MTNHGHLDAIRSWKHAYCVLLNEITYKMIKNSMIIDMQEKDTYEKKMKVNTSKLSDYIHYKGKSNSNFCPSSPQIYCYKNITF